MINISKLTLGLVLFLGLVGNAQSAVIAIIDSGTDMLHKDIAPKAWENPGEIANNEADDDNNGFVDDLYGWNFAENNNKVIDYSYLGTLSPDIRRFFDIQAKAIMGLASEQELQWMRNKVQDQDFIKKLSVYGNFMHGTHVAGIAAKGADDAKIMAAKIIPTEVKLPFPSMVKSAVKNEGGGDFSMILFKLGLSQLAKQQVKTLEAVAKYVGDLKAQVANGSFGTGYPQARMIVETLFKGLAGRDGTEEEINELTTYFLDVMIREGQHIVAAASQTLFVFAAGNDGTDNDTFPTSPTNIKASNVISVAATIGNKTLAKFSNFGLKMVDVAAPGVAIESAVPGNQYLKVSGTSQAAPYVANVAGQIKDINKDLGPSEIKKIILQTVDYKDFLKGRVVTGGLVNPMRALRAAELSKEFSMNQSLSRARTEIQDMESEKELGSNADQLEASMILPLPSLFKF